jgi:hypothetical protein
MRQVRPDDLEARLLLAQAQVSMENLKAAKNTYKQVNCY